MKTIMKWGRRMLKRLFCNHKYTFMSNPKHPELRGIWMNRKGKVWNKVICEKCGKIKKTCEEIK